MDDLIFVGENRRGADVGGDVVGDAVENAGDVVDPECVGATASKLYEGGVLSHVGGNRVDPFGGVLERGIEVGGGGSFDCNVVKNIEKGSKGAFVDELVPEVCAAVVLDAKFEEPLEGEGGWWRVFFIRPPRVSSFSVLVSLRLISLLLIVEHFPDVDPQIWHRRGGRGLTFVETLDDSGN